MNKIILSTIIAASTLLTGCLTRIETGEVGVRVNASKEVQGSELQPGSWNQTMWGSVLTFQVKDVALKIEDKTPLTSENSALSDFDYTVMYNINPTQVAEIYGTKSKTFHGVNDSKDITLMSEYITQAANNAVYKVIRKYESLKVADNREAIEHETRALINDKLQQDKLDTAITISSVVVRSVRPNAAILQSVNDFIKSQNELKQKETEVQIAKKEAERMAALASNAGQSISYMQAQANMKIAEGIANGKVNTIVVPMDFKGMVNIGK